MAGEHEEPTIALSLVDGISCGLAAALLLFIIFGINISVSTSSLGGTGSGTVTTKMRSDYRGEPVDIVIQVTGPPSETLGSPGWRPVHNANDYVVRSDTDGGLTTFIRELPEIGEAIGVLAPTSDVAFTLHWSGANAPMGTISVFRSGANDSAPFRCKSVARTYQIIESFDLVKGLVEGECSPPAP